MIKDEIIEMARDSGMELYGLGKDRYRFVHHLEAFAKLVAAKERERIVAENAIEIERCNAYIEELERLTQTGQIGINPEIVGYVAQKSKWVGLTYEDMIEIWNKLYKERTDVLPLPTTFGKAIQAKLKDKNTRRQE